MRGTADCYATEYKLDPKEYSFLKTPGTYELPATCISPGGTTPQNSDWKIPSYPIWKGELKSNRLKLQVVPAKR